jgi:hypothetical protein
MTRGAIGGAHVILGAAKDLSSIALRMTAFDDSNN